MSSSEINKANETRKKIKEQFDQLDDLTSNLQGLSNIFGKMAAESKKNREGLDALKKQIKERKD